MADQLKPASTFVAARVPIVDENRMATWNFLKILQDWDTKLRNGLNQIGQIIGDIPTTTKIVGRGAIGTILQFITDAGVVTPDGLPAATTTEQGAVILPVGASSNTLGTAAIEPSTAFDPSGAAASAQTAAEAHADTVAATAESNAEAFATAAVAAAFAPGINATIVTAALTLAGTQGSMTFTRGLLTAETPAT